MKNNFLFRYLQYFLSTISIFTLNFSVGLAQIETETGGGDNSGGSSSGNSITLDNPLAGGGIDNIPSLVEAILDIVLTIGVPIVAIAIIYSGFKFIAAQGNPEKLKEAKQTLLYVLIGAAILLAAWAIAQAVFSTVAAIRG